MYSPAIVITVFFSGCAVGGLLVSLLRRAAMEKIKREFAQELEETAAKNWTSRVSRNTRYDA